MSESEHKSSQLENEQVLESQSIMTNVTMTRGKAGLWEGLGGQSRARALCMHKYCASEQLSDGSISIFPTYHKANQQD